MDKYMLWFIISACINAFAIAEFWIFWQMAKQQFEGLRNFFMRNSGYGYLFILHPEGRVVPKFKKFKQTMKVENDRYVLKSERVYSFNGMKCLFYNKGDNMPINLQSLKKDELWANAEFFDNVFANIKTAAETEAEAKGNMQNTLLWVCVGILVLILFAGVYVVYGIQNGDIIIQATP